MNLSACSSLSRRPQTGVWYRAIDPKYFPQALETVHARSVPSRFYCPGGATSFELLYLAENHLVAMMEVQGLLGTPTTPGSVISNPGRPWVLVSVDVQLQQTVDLTDVSSTETLLASTAQELTGDWRAYTQRGIGAGIPAPVGQAPTQELGCALYLLEPPLEGFVTFSAKLPYHRILCIFRNHLAPGSYARFRVETSDGTRTHTIKG